MGTSRKKTHYAEEFADIGQKKHYTVIPADSNALWAYRFINRMKNISHVIIHRIHHEADQEQNYYYIKQCDDFLNTLRTNMDNKITVKEILDLHEYQSVSAKGRYDEIEDEGQSFVILDQNHVVGFHDPQWQQTRDSSSHRRDALAFGNTIGAGRDIVVSEGKGRKYEKGESGYVGFRSNLEMAKPEPDSFRVKGPEAKETVTRVLNTQYQQETVVGDEIPCDVSLAVSRSGGGESSQPMDIVKGHDLVIEVNPVRGFKVVGDANGIFQKVGEIESIPLNFRLLATETGRGIVDISAFQDGRPLGSLTIVPYVYEKGTDFSKATISIDNDLAPISSNVPDLTIVIREIAGVSYSYEVKVNSPKTGKYFEKICGSFSLKTDPAVHFNELYKDIEDLTLDTDEDKKDAERMLSEKGLSLFSAVVPKELQDILWDLRDSDANILIASKEPWIPWELCKLQGQVNGKWESGPFLCEAFNITRWHAGIGLKKEFTMNKIALVVPNDSGLKYALEERQYLLGLKNGRDVKVIGANWDDVTAAMASGEYDCWHFSGHGGFRSTDPNNSVILLSDNKRITPGFLEGEARNLGSAKPIVFLNACQVGRSAMSLTDIGGWAKQFVDKDASVFIGAYWSVADKPAFDFAKKVYDMLLAGHTIGKAVKEARLSIRGDPTWLAYTVYADPYAKLSNTR